MCGRVISVVALDFSVAFVVLFAGAPLRFLVFGLFGILVGRFLAFARGYLGALLTGHRLLVADLGLVEFLLAEDAVESSDSADLLHALSSVALGLEFVLD